VRVGVRVKVKGWVRVGVRVKVKGWVRVGGRASSKVWGCPNPSPSPNPNPNPNPNPTPNPAGRTTALSSPCAGGSSRVAWPGRYREIRADIGRYRG